MKTLKIVVIPLLLAGMFLAGVSSLAYASSSASNVEGHGVGFGTGSLGTGSGPVSGCTGTCTYSSTTSVDSSTPLSVSEQDALIYMVEEEKLARDVYTFLATQWSLPLFGNIAQSEQTHMDALLVLIDRYGLTNPVSATAGVFTNTSLQSLYTSLTQKGSQSLAEALLVGGAIEELDIADLQTRLASTTHLDLQQVLNNLMLGSYNHLQAFANTYQVETGSVYTPQTLSPEAYQTAIETTSGMYGATGRGMGRGGSGMH
ncbi:MAG: DUF2202 domain-containing protein [Anaerolineaceae bacterium]|nr:DUF2202 domain-containing protein [Anaerolineaceae bacterium]